MEHLKCAMAALLFSLSAFTAAAQTPSAPAGDTAPAAQTPAPAPSTDASAAPAEWSVGPISFSGMIDGYYSLNFNHPASKANQLRNFDVQANQFSLNMAKLTMEHTPDPVGFRVDLGFGRTFDVIHASEQAPGIFRNLEQAYISLKPKQAKGLEVDFGQFVTAAGAEVIETQSNWNYSRSLLFSWAIPYYHFGLRATMPAGKYWTVGGMVTNGWNNIEDNNTGKTAGVLATFTAKKFSWTNNYIVGAEKTDINKGLRHLYDTTLLLTPTNIASVYINFDYGIDKNVGPGEKRWVGVAGAARFAINSWFAIAPRLEWFNDADGFSTGTRQKIKEGTVTAEFKMREGFLTRLEYRRDWSDTNFFDRGPELARSKSQPTLLAGFVAFFGPKR